MGRIVDTNHLNSPMTMTIRLHFGTIDMAIWEHWDTTAERIIFCLVLQISWRPRKGSILLLITIYYSVNVLSLLNRLISYHNLKIYTHTSLSVSKFFSLECVRACTVGIVDIHYKLNTCSLAAERRATKELPRVRSPVSAGMLAYLLIQQIV